MPICTDSMDRFNIQCRKLADRKLAERKLSDRAPRPWRLASLHQGNRPDTSAHREKRLDQSLGRAQRVDGPTLTDREMRHDGFVYTAVGRAFRKLSQAAAVSRVKGSADSGASQSTRSENQDMRARTTSNAPTDPNSAVRASSTSLSIRSGGRKGEITVT